MANVQKHLANTQPAQLTADQGEKGADEHLYIDYVVPYGKQSKPRHMDPSMFQLMQWDEAESAPEFKASKQALRDMDDYRRYRALIDRAHDGYTTEAKDNYKKFVYKKLDQDLQPMKIPFEDTIRPSHDKRVVGQQRAKSNQISTKLPEFAYHDVVHTLTGNKVERDLADHPARRSTSRDGAKKYQRSGMLDWPDDEHIRRMRIEEKEKLVHDEQAKIDEELRRQEAEDVSKLLKAPDYSKVQNRLLSYKVERRKELDPEKDSERIKRRQDRIEVSNL
jgi:hypothetical protein